MALISFEKNVCTRCSRNGKCEVQKEFVRAGTALTSKINEIDSDDGIVTNVIITCNRGGE